jgi:hypothetical protein
MKTKSISPEINMNYLDDLINNDGVAELLLNDYKFTTQTTNVIENRRRRFLHYQAVMTALIQEVKKSIFREANKLDPLRLKSFANQIFAQLIAIENRHFVVNPPDKKRNYDSDLGCLQIAITIALRKFKDDLRTSYKKQLSMEYRKDFYEFVQRLLDVGKYEVIIQATKKKITIPDGEIPELAEHIRLSMLDLQENYDDFYLIWKNKELIKDRASSELDFIDYCKKLLARDTKGNITIFQMRNYQSIDDLYIFKEKFLKNCFGPMLAKVVEFLEYKRKLFPSAQEHYSNTKTTTIETLKPIKFKTSLSVPELALLSFALRKELSPDSPQSDMEKVFSQYFSSKESVNVSANSLHNQLSKVTDTNRQKISLICLGMRNTATAINQNQSKKGKPK